MSADALLNRLEKVKSTGPDRWIARCPAHTDKSPSLSIREKSDGCVLLHCFAGCSVEDVVVAVGLELSDLFPEPLPTTATPAQRRERRDGFAALDVLTALVNEVTHVAIAAGTIQRRGWLNDEECDRLELAYERIVGAVAYVGRSYG